MMLDTDVLRQKIETFYAGKVEQIEDSSLSDKLALHRLQQFESWESCKLSLIDDVEALYIEFD
jgi:hypothetical protein